MQQIDLNPKFELTLRFINQTNRSVFLTGKAGTGKTTLLKHIRQNTFKQMAVVAPTGVAAINAGGSTIHSFFQFPFTPFISHLKENGEIDIARSQSTLKYNSQRLAIFRNLELLIIDEISMVRADLLDQIDITLRQTRKKWNQPFGGVQVLLIGDMYQLPPVVQPEEWRLLGSLYQSPFFFDSIAVRNNPPAFIELDKIYRQSDPVFIDLLNKVRRNNLDPQNLERLNAHYKPNISLEEYDKNITLTTHNRKADEINTRNLKALSGKEFTFRSKVDGLFSEKNFPVEEALVLKKGARVMFLKNNTEKNYYNGKIGVISFIGEDKIKVMTDEDHQEIEVGRETWTNVSYKLDKSTKHIDEEILGTFNHYPLRLAWAITIHKSQGLTFDKLIIDAAESFSAGQVYVALSRCRSLEGLILSSRINPQTLLNDKTILSFSASKQSNEQLNSIFSTSQREYIKTLLVSLFDFSEAVRNREDLAGNVQLYNARLNNDGKVWAAHFFQKIDGLNEVSSKFKNQLAQLLDQALPVEADNVLQERIKKASVYFETELKKCIDHLKNCTLQTESKEAATIINELLQILFEDLFRKYTLIRSCERGFIFSDFIKQKLNLVFPDVRINVYASAGNTKISSEVKHPQLYRQLLLLRDELCNEEHKPIYLVASNKTLIELANYLPKNTPQLLKITGFGDAKVEQYGEQFLKIIRNYMLENDLESAMDLLKPKKEKKSKSKKKTETESNEVDAQLKKVSSKEQTFNLFKHGFSLKEISEERGMALSTVEGHLIPFIANGELNITELMSTEKQKLILAALEDFTYEMSLNVVKNKLPTDISFADIRYVLADKLKTTTND